MATVVAVEKRNKYMHECIEHKKYTNFSNFKYKKKPTRTNRHTMPSQRDRSGRQNKPTIIEYLYKIRALAVDIEEEGGPTDTEKPEIKQLDDCFKKLLIQEEKEGKYKKEIKQKLETQLRDASYEDVGKIFEVALSGMQLDIDFSKNGQYKKFRNEVLHVYHPNDIYGAGDDDVMDYLTFNIYCPISKGIMEKPVRSSVCHHVYDEPNILQLIRQGRGSCGCPVAGCSCIVKRDFLEKNREIELEIEQERKKREQLESQKVENAVELD